MNPPARLRLAPIERCARQALRALAAIVLWIAVGCAVPYDQLVPFPCPIDQHCPDGLSCVPGIGCTTAQLDALCTAATDCQKATPGATCQRGICAPSCLSGQGCMAQRVCSSALTDGACLFDCSAGQRCPSGLVCQDLHYDQRRGCLPATESAPACLSIDPAPVLRTCGAANFNVSCGGGSSCPADSYCIANNRCRCNPGFVAVTCGGDTCDSGCSYPNWWCIPDTVSPSCAATSGWGPQILHCADGRATPIGCATQSSCEQLCQSSASGCDTVTQNCLDGAAPKCTLLTPATGGGATACVAAPGARPPGSPCQIAGADGLDSCQRGNICTDFGAPNNAPVCRQFCRTDAQCPGGLHCIALSSRSPADGVCLPSCQLFAGCPPATPDPALTCTPTLSLDLQVVGYCRAIGSGAAGSACQDDRECSAQLTCDFNGTVGTCTALCDSSQACSSGTCTAFHSTTLQNGAGECL